MRRVLLIRQIEESLSIANLLKSKEIETVIYPLFKLCFFSLPPLQNPQALIITSKNALRALKNRRELKKIPVYAVGDQTASFAQNMGFSKVFNASGTSQELTQLILEHANPKKGVLWHLSGENIKGNIVETLQSTGFEAKRHIIYKIDALEDFIPPLLLDLQNQKITHVMFFSPHTTSIFVTLLKKNGLKRMTPLITSLCLSRDVAKAASQLAWKKIWICPQPTTETMMRYFDEE